MHCTSSNKLAAANICEKMFERILTKLADDCNIFLEVMWEIGDSPSVLHKSDRLHFSTQVA